MQKNGIFVMSGFAVAWFIWGLSAFHAVPAPLLAVPVAVSAALAFCARRLPDHRSAAERKRIGRVIGWATLGEFVAILAANTVLASTGHADFAVCATAGIVGLHFLPLAHFLRVPRYHAAGAAMMALAAAGCAAPDAQLRLMIVGFGAAVLLWGTCLANLTSGPASPTAAVA